jgi:hypothetical protein
LVNATFIRHYPEPAQRGIIQVDELFHTVNKIPQPIRRPLPTGLSV